MDPTSPKKPKRFRFQIGEHVVPEMDSGSTETVQTEENSLAPLLSTPSEVSPPQMSIVTDFPSEYQSGSSSPVNKQNVIDLFYVSHPSPNEDRWVEKSRFIRYEEDREGYDNHFGKPHVPCIPMEHYRNLLQIANKSIVMTDVPYLSFDSFCDYLEEQMVDPEIPNIGKIIVKLLMSRRGDGSSNGPFRTRRLSSSQSLAKSTDGNNFRLRQLMSVPNNLHALQNAPSSRKLTNALSTLKFLAGQIEEETDVIKEETMIIAGSVSDLEKCRLIMIRFEDAAHIPELTHSSIDVRCLYFLTGPTVEHMNYVDIGRALGSVLSNPEFSGLFNTLVNADHITSTIEHYLSESVVLAPGRIDNKYLVAGDLIRKVVNKQADKHDKTVQDAEIQRKEMDVNVQKKVDLEKSQPPEKQEQKWGLFSGMIEDIRHRSQFYSTDWYDGMNMHALKSTIFMFCACIAPSLTFGGLMHVYTGGAMGVWETLMSQCISGVIWSIFAGQPLIIVSSTGPFLVFEHALYQICVAQNLELMVVRFWAGVAIFVYSLIVTAFGGARLLKYLTMFTEDIFSVLISLIFLNEVVKFVKEEWEMNPVHQYSYYNQQRLACLDNETETDCSHLSAPNSFLLSFNIIICTFVISFVFRQLSRSRWFGRNFRNICGDFGIFFAILIVSTFRYLLFNDVNIETLELPSKTHNHTISNSTGIIENAHLILIKPHVNDWKILPVAAGAGALVFILLFVETEITEQMLLRKDRKLKKGGGLHWDLVLMGFIVFIDSALGLPWMCAAAVQSLAHCSSLTVLKKKAPGEPAKPVSVIEQRTNTLILSIEMGIFAYLGQFVHIPTACFFGVFLYLGVVNLYGNQFIKRFFMFFLPSKHRGPDKYLEAIPFFRIVLYTLIQLSLVCAIFAIKLNEHMALFFPLVLASFIIGRQLILPFIFTEKELEMLDGEHEQAEEIDAGDLTIDCYYNTRIPV